MKNSLHWLSILSLLTLVPPHYSCAQTPLGETWTCITTNASFSPRSGQGCCVFKDRLWIIGGSQGFGDEEFTNDVWSSSDGSRWELATKSAAFSKRYGSAFAVFQDKLWLVGGTGPWSGGDDPRRKKSEVWCSQDGVHWTLVTDHAAFPARAYPGLVAFKDKLWVIGGTGCWNEKEDRSDHFYRNDVWCSSDGLKWTCVTPQAGFPKCTAPLALIHKNRIWIMSCFTGSPSSAVWSSPNGKTWVEVTKQPGFGARNHAAGFVYLDKMWLLGGRYGDGRGDDVWNSTDGVHWTLVKEGAGFKSRQSHSAVVFKGRLWVIAGEGTNNEVWSSP